MKSRSGNVRLCQEVFLTHLTLRNLLKDRSAYFLRRYGTGLLLGMGNSYATALISGFMMSGSVGFEDYLRTGSPLHSPELHDEDGNSLLTPTEEDRELGGWDSLRVYLRPLVTSFP